MAEVTWSFRLESIMNKNVFTSNIDGESGKCLHVMETLRVDVEKGGATECSECPNLQGRSEAQFAPTCCCSSVGRALHW